MEDVHARVLDIAKGLDGGQERPAALIAVMHLGGEVDSIMGRYLLRETCPFWRQGLPLTKPVSRPARERPGLWVKSLVWDGT